jgi:hypothetical protein
MVVDTSVKEYTAEDLITYKLQRFGVYVAKPKFDVEGTDLFAMLKVESDTGVIFKYCRVQCKYRSLVGPRKNPIQINESYVRPDFIVFLYVEDGDIAENHLFCFFWEDIKSNSSPWTLRGNHFRLSIKRKNFKETLTRYVFDQTKLDRIKQRIKTSFEVIEPIHVFLEATEPVDQAKIEISTRGENKID